jgi:hypothetical protein
LATSSKSPISSATVRDRAPAPRRGRFTVNVNGQTKAQIERENPTFFSVYPTVQDGRVISQSLPAGSMQPRGAAISIAYYKVR